MPSPQISFPDDQAELRYGLRVLVDAGLTLEQIDKMRDKVGQEKFLTTKKPLDFVGSWCKNYLQPILVIHKYLV